MTEQTLRRRAWARMLRYFLAECPFCFALIYKDRLGVHTEAHGSSDG